MAIGGLSTDGICKLDVAEIYERGLTLTVQILASP
jgi:hypothetical protein